MNSVTLQAYNNGVTESIMEPAIKKCLLSTFIQVVLLLGKLNWEKNL